MELDELKDIWKQTPIIKNKKTDLMEIIRQKNYGPVAELKRSFRKQILLMSIIPFVLILTNSNDFDKVVTSIMFWCYVAFCLCMILLAAYNYRIAKGMEVMDGDVRSNLLDKANLLEKRARMEIIVIRVALLFFIALTELIPYVQHYRMLDKWHSLPVLTRFGSYAGLLLLQYFISKKKKQRNIGRHLTYLKNVLSEMQ
jgi:hypothetical protein